MVKQRENTRRISERRNSKGELLCLVPTCDSLRQKYKTCDRTRNYCENHTFQDIQQFTNWSALREKVLKRDNYTCTKCGDNKKQVQVTKKYKKSTNSYLITDLILKRTPFNEIPKHKYEWRKRKEIVNNLIADHIIPIALGGDEWDMLNIQTLCNKCNNLKTKQDAKDIAALRRKEKDENV